MSVETSTGGAKSPLGHPRVCYVTSEEARAAADALPSNKGRSSLVHSLIESLDLLDYEKELDDSGESESSAHFVEKTPANAHPRARVIETPRATRSELCRFHDKDYVEALFEAAAKLPPEDIGTPDTSLDSETCADPSKRQRVTENDDGEHGHGLEHDCPVFAELEDYCSFVAGGSLAAARALRQQEADIAIHWDGGRHHATKAGAAGFCYVNDIVLAILELQRSQTPAPSSSPLKRLKQVLYIDLDLHHGDGVAEAFEHTANVITVSLHLWSRGFYPSTPKGHLDHSGPATPSPAAGTALNIAIPGSGLSDASFLRLVNSCIKPIFEAFGPDAVVMQCGLDGLAGDPCGEFNLSLRGYGKVVETVLRWCHRRKATPSTQPSFTEAAVADLQGNGMIPVLLLGGGGYHSTNAARAWAYLTSIALGRPLDLDLVSTRIPEECNSWSTFVRDGSAGDALDIAAHVAKREENTEEDLKRIEAAFVEHVRILVRRKGKA